MATESSTSPVGDAQKHVCLFKIIVIGEPATGKTIIIKRYVNKIFPDPNKIGLDFSVKDIKRTDGTIARLQIWDIFQRRFGENRSGKMGRPFYRHSHGCIIVCDVTQPSTFDAIREWKAQLDEKVCSFDGTPIPCVLIANKCDLVGDDSVNDTQIDSYCQENGIDRWFKTSAKENVNINTAFEYLIDEMTKRTNDAREHLEKINPIKLSDNQNENGCCSLS